jgi:hypothetical protein
VEGEQGEVEQKMGGYVRGAREILEAELGRKARAIVGVTVGECLTSLS